MIIGVHEPETNQKAKSSLYSRRNILWAIFHHRLLFNVMLVSALIQIGNFSIQPLLSLYVSELSHTEEVALLAGITFSAAGLGNIFFARFWGHLSDQVGYEKVLKYLLIACVIFIVPQAFVTDLWQLMLLRFFYGIVSGGLIPITAALIRRDTPIEVQGEIMGYNQSFRFLGNILGPVLGGFIAGFGGIHSVFYTTGLLFLVSVSIYYVISRLPKQYMEDLLRSHVN